MPNKPKMFPIQKGHLLPRDSAKVRESVYMRAYEVYCHVYAPQEALITGSCRSGFGIGELVGFLYASGFPRDEWRKRFDEALVGMKL